MKGRFLLLVTLLSGLRILPHLVVFLTCDREGLICSDLERWWKVVFKEEIRSRRGKVWALIWFMTWRPEFRNLFYKRTGMSGQIFSFLCPKMPSLFIATEKIGRGLYIQHGFATIIAADRIGDNCWINQQVTVGYAASNAAPVLEDGVVVNAGAKVIGDVTIGRNTVIGANAVVVKSLPPNCTAVGVPARVVKIAGVRTHDRGALGARA